MERSSVSRRVGKKGERAAGVVRIVPAGMVEVSGVDWPLVGFRLVDMTDWER